LVVQGFHCLQFTCSERAGLAEMRQRVLTSLFRYFQPIGETAEHFDGVFPLETVGAGGDAWGHA
jgi:hypothetical protein